MATPIGTTEYTKKPRNLTPEYEVERDGQTLLCQMIAYRGQIYEVCRSDTNLSDHFQKLIPEPFVGPGDAGYEDLVDLLDRSSTCSEPEATE